MTLVAQRIPVGITDSIFGGFLIFGKPEIKSQYDTIRFDFSLHLPNIPKRLDISSEGSPLVDLSLSKLTQDAIQLKESIALMPVTLLNAGVDQTVILAFDGGVLKSSDVPHVKHLRVTTTIDYLKDADFQIFLLGNYLLQLSFVEPTG